MKKEIILFFTVLFLLTLFLMPFTAAAKKTAAVTILPQLEMVEAVAGDKLEFVEMIPKGFNPANYAPSPSEMRAFNQASIYFSIGVPADMQNILPRAAEVEGLKVVKLFEEVAKKYPHRYFNSDEEAAQTEKAAELESEKAAAQNQAELEKKHSHDHSGGRDPHLWLSPPRAAYMVEIIRDELIRLLPESEAEFRKNAEKYLKKLRAVDRENKNLLQNYQGEKILVYHPSFGYFTEHYGLEMLVIEKDGKDPGPRHLQQVIEKAAAAGIENVFYQAEIDSRKTRAAAESLGGEIVELNPLAENYLENLKLMAQKLAAELAERDDY